MKGRAILALMALAGGLASCKPPPTDAAVARVSLSTAVAGPAEPLPSPDVQGAVWAQGGAAQAALSRLVYGVPGQPVLLALECVDGDTPDARVRITRHAPADEGAAALLALIGNGRIARIEVDATPRNGQVLWQGEAPAIAPGWDALAGQREATVTVPGAGLVRLNPSPLTNHLLASCRAAQNPVTDLLPDSREGLG